MGTVVRVCLILALGSATWACAEEPPADPPDSLPDFDRLWDYRKPAETEARFRELLPRAEASGNVSYHLQLLTQIGRTLGLQGNFEEAHRVLDDVEKRLTDDVPAARVRYLLERGRAHNSSGKTDETEKARALFLAAWELARAKRLDRFAVDAAHMMGIVEPLEKQLHWSLEALKVVEASDDPRIGVWRGTLYHNIGMTYLDKNEAETALDYFRKDWAFRKEHGNPFTTHVAKWCVAHAMRKLGRIDDALAMQREMEKERAEAGEPDGFVLEEIAECLLAQEKAVEAGPYFLRAYEILEAIDWLVKEEPERIARLRALAGVEEEQPESEE